MSASYRFARLVFKIYHIVRGPHLPACRYLPSCSEYASEAVEVHGLIRGGLFAVKRILRCHPWGGWGVDPVPGHFSPKNQ